MRLLPKPALMLIAVTPESKEHERTLPERPSLEVGPASLFSGNSNNRYVVIDQYGLSNC